MFDSEAIESLHTILQTKTTEITIPKPNGAEERVVIVPSGYRKELLYDQPALIPARLKQQVSFDELNTFAAYLNRFGNPASTVIFLLQSETSITLQAVLDYHRPAEEADYGLYRIPASQTVVQGFREHQATFSPVQTPEWKIWVANNKHQMEQEKFAQFLRENQPDIAKPVAADLIELCSNMSVTEKVYYTKAFRDQDGSTHLEYKKDNEPNGKIVVPEDITLRLVPYRGEPSMDLEAKLRYRLKDGACYFFYDLVRPHKVLEACATEMRQQIVGLTDKKFPVYSGAMTN